MSTLISAMMIVLFFSSCSISMTCSNSGGAATDQVDTGQTTSPTTNATVTVPLT